MEVTFAGIPITGPTQSEWAGPIGLPWSTVNQIEQLFRAPAPFAENRGNDICTARFRVYRRYASFASALVARGSFWKSLPKKGELEFSIATEGQTVTYFCPDSLLDSQPAEPVLMGVAVIWQWQFQVVALQTFTTAGNLLRSDNGTILRGNDGQPLLS